MSRLLVSPFSPCLVLILFLRSLLERLFVCMCPSHLVCFISVSPSPYCLPFSLSLIPVSSLLLASPASIHTSSCLFSSHLIFWSHLVYSFHLFLTHLVSHACLMSSGVSSSYLSYLSELLIFLFSSSLILLASLFFNFHLISFVSPSLLVSPMFYSHLASHPCLVSFLLASPFFKPCLVLSIPILSLLICSFLISPHVSCLSHLIWCVLLVLFLSCHLLSYCFTSFLVSNVFVVPVSCPLASSCLFSSHLVSFSSHLISYACLSSSSSFSLDPFFSHLVSYVLFSSIILSLSHLVSPFVFIFSHLVCCLSVPSHPVVFSYQPFLTSHLI